MTPQERLALALQYQKKLGGSLPSTPAENAARPVQEPTRTWLDNLSDIGSGYGYQKAQDLEDLLQATKHPLDTLHSMAVGVGKAMDNPVATAQSAWQGAKDFASNAVSSPYNLGGAIASATSINPRKIAAALESPAVRRNIFIGKTAKTWNEKEADRALAMEAVGVDPETIWKETGTFKGPEGKWRQEISDENAKGAFTHFGPVKNAPISPDEAESHLTRWSDTILKHPELIEAYPDLAQIKQFGFEEPKQKGSYQARYMETSDKPGVRNLLDETIIAKAPNENSLASTALHEMQHAIQRREAFQRGASFGELKNKPIPSQLKDVAFARSMQEMAISQKMRELGYPINEGKMLNLSLPNVLETVKEFSKNNQQLNDLIEKYQNLNSKLQKYPDKYAQYARSAGEVEARAVQSRQKMTPEERRATFPLLSYDVPVNELIFSKK